MFKDRIITFTMFHDGCCFSKSCVFHVQDPKTYVSALLEVHQKYSAMVTLSFRDDAGFIQALDKVVFIVFMSCSPFY